MPLSAFKAYDIRGKIPSELNPCSVAAIAEAFFHVLQPKKLVIGADARQHSLGFAQLIGQVMQKKGVIVHCLPLCGTEEVYFYTAQLKADLGIMVTASHNPIDYNGLKYVGKGAAPILKTEIMTEIRTRTKAILAQNPPKTYPSMDSAVYRGSNTGFTILDKKSYITKLLSFIDLEKLKPLKLVINSGNGAAGPVIDALEPLLPFKIIKVHNEPDASFPNGIPNPLLPERRKSTSYSVLQHKADLGIAFDGDFDRCFFFDSKGHFIEGYYLVGLIAKALLETQKGESIVYDPRLTWATEEAIVEAGGKPIISRSGHSFIKQKMREVNAVYGGEMSAHHYFKDFAYCDTGMLPWLILTQYLCTKKETLENLVDDAINAYPCSGEINFKVQNPDNAIEAIVSHFTTGEKNITIENLDGVSVQFENWRFNIRKSNTEPLVRLNVEARRDKALMQNKTQALSDHLKTM